MILHVNIQIAYASDDTIAAFINALQHQVVAIDPNAAVLVHYEGATAFPDATSFEDEMSSYRASQGDYDFEDEDDGRFDNRG